MHINLTAWGVQHDFVMDRSRYSAFIGGIGIGKTRALCIKALVTMLMNPGSYSMMTAPTYPMLRDATKRTFLELCPPELIARRNDSENTLSLYTPDGDQAHIIFRSTSDPDTLRGPNILAIFMDEASQSSEESFRILIGRLRGGDADSDFRQISVATTPKGLNWLYRRWGTFPLKDGYRVFQAATRDNPFLPADFVESVYSEYEGTWAQQELEGAFVPYEGLIYGDLWVPAKHIPDLSWEQGQYLDYDDKYDVDLAWDFGHKNYTAVLAIQQMADSTVRVFDEVYRLNRLDEEVAAEVRARPWFYLVKDVICDEARPDSIMRLGNLGIPARASQKGKILDGIGRVRSLMAIDKAEEKPKLLVSKRCEGLLNEINLYRWKDKKTETDEWSDTPIDQFNHGLDAFRYWAVSKWWPPGVRRSTPQEKVRGRGGHSWHEEKPKRRVMSYQRMR